MLVFRWIRKLTLSFFLAREFSVELLFLEKILQFLPALCEIYMAPLSICKILSDERLKELSSEREGKWKNWIFTLAFLDELNVACVARSVSNGENRNGCLRDRGNTDWQANKRIRLGSYGGKRVKFIIRPWHVFASLCQTSLGRISNWFNRFVTLVLEDVEGGNKTNDLSVWSTAKWMPNDLFFREFHVCAIPLSRRSSENRRAS